MPTLDIKNGPREILPFAHPAQDNATPDASQWVFDGIDQAIRLARRAARSRASILVTGESGTGKEVISQFIHDNSDRADHRMQCVNCAALPESLIESELFGHRRGAFTGADSDRAGVFETASGSTLLLDEISEIPVSIQAKLLRVLETQSVTRVGSHDPLPIDVRIVATSNRLLQRQVASGNFRLDLFHRLKVIHIHLEPLRQRRADIMPLARKFLNRFSGESDACLSGFHPTAVDRLMQHDWPGNVRELRNVIHRAAILADGPLVQVDHLGSFERDESCEAPTQAFGNRTLAEIERDAILQTLQRYDGNRTEAARHLGVSTKTIFNKMQLYAREDQANTEFPVRLNEDEESGRGPAQAA